MNEICKQYYTGVPQTMTLGDQLKMSSSNQVSMFDTKENNEKIEYYSHVIVKLFLR